MAMSGELSVLEDFKQFFLGKVLENGTQVVLLWDPATSVLQLKVLQSTSRDLLKVRTTTTTKITKLPLEAQRQA